MLEKESSSNQQSFLSQMQIGKYMNVNGKTIGILFAVLVGALVAYAAIGIRFLIHIAQLYSLGTFSEHVNMEYQNSKFQKCVNM